MQRQRTEIATRNEKRADRQNNPGADDRWHVSHENDRSHPQAPVPNVYGNTEPALELA